MNTRLGSNLGKYGEDFACRYLQNKGYKIVTRNFRCHRLGEIDIIAEKEGCISFIEVKARATSRFGRPIEAVTPVKQRKIYRCAEYYLQCRGLLVQPPLLSFDVIEIFIEGSASITIRHWPQCF